MEREGTRWTRLPMTFCFVSLSDTAFVPILHFVQLGCPGLAMQRLRPRSPDMSRIENPRIY